MKTSLIKLGIIGLAAIAVVPAFAGNDGRGGDAIVCFEKGVIPAVAGYIEIYGSGYRLSKKGRENIKTAETREGYRIRHLTKHSPFLESLTGKTEDQAFAAMLKRFEGVPAFYQLLVQMNEDLDAIGDGFNSRGGLEDIKDTGLSMSWKIRTVFSFRLLSVRNQLSVATATSMTKW